MRPSPGPRLHSDVTNDLIRPGAPTIRLYPTFRWSLCSSCSGRRLSDVGRGIELSKSTDELDTRLGIGDALGGMVLLAIAASLPELAITVSAAASGHLDLAAGNLIGGIATATIASYAAHTTVSMPRTRTEPDLCERPS